MNATLWLAAAVACAQFAAPETTPRDEDESAEAVENGPGPKPAASKLVAVTVYQGQALVTREVKVPEGEGTVELVVTPLPPQTVDGSLFAEGAEGSRVLSTRFRSRAVKDDTRGEVRAKEALLKKLQTEGQRLQKEAEVRGQDLQYLQKLEGFTGASLTAMTEKGWLDSEGILTLSKFVMDSRSSKAKAEIELRQQIEANAEAVAFAERQIVELSAGSSRTERDAVVVVQKGRPEAGVVRLGYLVGQAGWTPRYRLKAAADGGPVRVEYLAAVTQRTGEPWDKVRVTLSNARPSLDAAPPELLPLKMKVTGEAESGSIDDKYKGSRRVVAMVENPVDPRVANETPVEDMLRDERSRLVVAELEKPIEMHFANETPFEDVLKYVRNATTGPLFPDGLPIYIEPAALQEAEKTMTSPVTMDLGNVPLRTTLGLLLEQLGLKYRVKAGVVKITGESSDDDPGEEERGMAGTGKEPASGGAALNREAAGDQARELRVSEGQDSSASSAEKDGPSVTFSVAGTLDIPSRRDPQLLEVAHAELPAEYYAKAVPVLTPRVYRLAKLTNTSELVLLPGEATVYVGTDFVGRMRLPLVAAGEPFIAGFGVDPQVQVSRRLARKARSIQGGNQVFTYEFRLGLRNYRSVPVKVELWDRLPAPEDEAVSVHMVKTSVELSNEPLYLRTARMDNLLRWDVKVPQGTVGEKTLYLNYEFKLEYARDLPQPRYLSGSLKESPIGGGAMGVGGMGGMGGGFH